MSYVMNAWCFLIQFSTLFKSILWNLKSKRADQKKIYSICIPEKSDVPGHIGTKILFAGGTGLKRCSFGNIYSI